MWCRGVGPAHDSIAKRRVQRELKTIKIAKTEKKGKEKSKKKYKKALIPPGITMKVSSEFRSTTCSFYFPRKLGTLYYLIGLSIEPNHKGINEYSSELYLQNK